MEDDARPPQAWHGAGPVLDDDLVAEVRGLLAQAGRPVPDELTHGTAVASLSQLWADARQGAEVDLQGVRDLEGQLEQLRSERTREALEALARVVDRLEAAPCSVPELVAMVPQLVCELGFSRALVSQVREDVWTPELMYVVGDPESSEELTRVGKAEPVRLVPGMFETDVVRTRSAVLATNVHREPWRSHPCLAAASQTRSYVVAPLLSDGQVVGLLHGERFAQGRDVDDLDRQLLGALAQAVRLAVSRASLADDLEAFRKAVTLATREVSSSVARVHRLPALRPSRGPGDDPIGLVVRTGLPGLPADLSRREREVLELMAAGKANGAIARTLGIAEGTVKQHVKHVLRKLMVGSRAEAVTRWFLAHGGPDAPG